MWQTEDYKTRVIEGMKKVWREDPRLKRRQSEIAKELWRKGTFANRPCVPCPEEKKKRLAAASKRVWKDPGLRGKLLKGCQTKWRREAPKAERLLHAQLRKHHIPYQTQAILATLYVVDILLPKAAVVIECDEKSHTWGKFRKKDKKRDATLKNLGFTVIRIPTAKILTDPAAVFQKYLGGLALVE
jgi:very-short-patch-repair endonuclease